MKTLVLVSLLLSLGQPGLAVATSDSLVLRFAVVVGTRAGAVRDFARVLDAKQMNDYLSSWDPNEDNPEIRELFALKGLSEVTRQVAVIPAAGGTVAGGAKIGARTWKIEVDVKAGEREPVVDLRIFRDGELKSAPSVRNAYGDRAIVSVGSEETGEQHFFVVQVDRAGGNGEQIAKDALDARPKLLHRVNPEYPSSEKESRREGDVVVVLRIGADGRVGDARVEQSLGAAFDEAAVEAVRQWRFEPARSAGRAVAAEFRVTIRFVPAAASDS